MRYDVSKTNSDISGSMPEACKLAKSGDPVVPIKIADLLRGSVQSYVDGYCSVLGYLPGPSEPTITWFGKAPSGATFVKGPFDDGDLFQYKKDLEAMVAEDWRNFPLIGELERVNSESLALVPVGSVELYRSTLKCTYRPGGEMNWLLSSVDGIETERLYEAEGASKKFVLISFGPKSEENDRLAQQAMQGHHESTRAIESPTALEARFEQYVADGVDRKLLKSFARDIVDCMISEGATPTKDVMNSYLDVFSRFALNDAAKRLVKFNSSVA